MSRIDGLGRLMQQWRDDGASDEEIYNTLRVAFEGAHDIRRFHFPAEPCPICATSDESQAELFARVWGRLCDEYVAPAQALIVDAIRAEQHKDARRIAAVFVFPNGMVAVTDQHGEQWGEFQGRREEALPKIREACKANAWKPEWNE